MADTPQPALSATELEILRLVATGATNREIARVRGISEATVKKHLTNVFGKMGTGNRTEAVRRALEQGLVTVDTPTSEPTSDDRDGVGHQAAVHLAQELELLRRRSRRVVQAVVVVALALAVGAAGLVAYVDRVPAPVASPEPTAVTASIPTWLPGVKLPSPRSRLAVVTTTGNGAIFAIGGRGETGTLSETLRNPIDAMRWERRADKPTAVEDVAGVTVRGEIIVPGGCLRDGSAVDVVEIYDPAADTWREAAGLPAPVCGYALAELDGVVFLLGGRPGEDAAGASDEVWRHEPESDQWRVVDHLPLACADLAAVVVGDVIHLLGGRDRAGKLLASHWVYRPFAPADSRWDLDSGAALPEGRAGLAAVASAVRNIYVVGGGWDRRLDDGTLLLRLASRRPTWEAQPDVPGFTPQRGAGMTLVEGRLLAVVGGEADDSPLDQHYRWEVVPSAFFFPGGGPK